MPNGLTQIENHAFEGCSSLTSITMPEGIQYIYSNAFEGLSGLRSVSIPASLISSPGTDAFRDCVNIDEVFITDLAGWCALDFSDYSTEQSNPMYYGAALYLNGRKVENLEIPEGVSLEKGAYNFTGCSSIRSVTIPASYEGGINWIFRNCKSIEQIRFLGTAPKFIASDAFQGITATVYYRGGDSGWTAENRLNYGGNLTWVQDGEITACQCTYSVQGTCTKCGNYQPAEQNADGFYEIANPGQLFWFVKMVNDDGSADAVLTDNITIPEDWQWVGISSYSSTFDGNGKYISGIHSTSGGMFGTLQNEAVVQNLTVKDCTFINSSGNAGAIANTVSNGLVSDCHIISCTISGSYAGGITGYTSGENIEIENCSISGTTTITATDSSSARSGGIVGYVYNGSLSVSGCTVEAAGISGMYSGGILGYLENAAGPYVNRYTTVTKCAVNATVSGSSAAGGIAGYISTYGNLDIDNCYAKAAVTSSAGAAGGILGEADDYLYNRTNAVISSCYSLAALTGTTFDHVYGSGSYVVKKIIATAIYPARTDT